MATLKIGKAQAEDVIAIQLVDNLLRIKTTTGLKEARLAEGRPIRVEVDGDCDQLKVRNSAKVFGNMGIAYAGNVFNIDGLVGLAEAGTMVAYQPVRITRESDPNNINFNIGSNNIVCGENNIVIDNGIITNNGIPLINMRNQRAQVVRISGNIIMADIIGPEMLITEIIVDGNVRLAQVGNVLDCKGNVDRAQSGNMVYINSR